MSNPIRRSADPATEADVAAFEEAIGHALPADYRASLFAANGGVPRRRAFRYSLPSGKARSARVLAFAPLGLEGWQEFDCRPLPDLWEADGQELVSDTVAVGTAETDVNEGTIRLGVRGEAAGRVFFRPEDTAKEKLYPVAASWTEFVAGLKHADKPDPWEEPIEDGDVDLLRRWLTRYRRRWDHGGDRISIERKAVEENQAEVLDMLVAEFEFEPVSIVEEALDSHRLDLAMHFLPAAQESGRLRGALNRAGPYLWHAPPLVAALLDAGADPTDEDDSGLTPLHHAARAGSADAVRLLLERGADPTLADDQGQTPRDLAERSEWLDVAAVLREAESRRAPDDGPALRPFDLCGVRFVRTGKPITLADIRAVETSLKLTFPPEYRWLLTQANGAILQPGLLPESVLPELYLDYEDEDEDEEEYEDEGEEEGPDVRLDLYPLREADCEEDDLDEDDPDAPSLSYSVEQAKGWYHDGSDIPRGFLPIGGLNGFGIEGSGFLLIGCRGPKRGQLFAFDHGEVPLNVTLPELFAKLAEAGRRPKSPAERLADAVESGDLDAVRAAVADGAATVWMTRDGRMPLRAACEKGFDEAAVLIGEAGDREQAIGEALSAGRVAAARRLFDGARKLKRDTLETIFYYPAIYTDPGFLAAVADRGVRLDRLFNHKDMQSPLLSAAASGSVAGLRFLLERGGKLNHVDREQGTTLLHAAVQGPGVDARAMIAFLLENGVPLNGSDAQGHTALHAAILANNPGAARALIDAGADLDYRAGRNSPQMNDPRTRRMMAQAEKEMQRLFRELERESLADDLSDEDAPLLDPDDPAAQQANEMAGLAAQMQEAMRGMLPRIQEKMVEQASGLGPPAADLAQRSPYPHVRPLIDELRRYAAGRRPTGTPLP